MSVDQQFQQVKSEVAQHALEWNERGALPGDLIARLGSQGLLSKEQSVFEILTQVESIAQVGPAVACALALQGLVARTVLQSEGPESGDALQDLLWSGELSATLGSREALSPLMLEKTGDAFTLTGECNSVPQSQAELIAVFAQDEDGVISAFLLPRSLPGVEVLPGRRMTGLTALGLADWTFDRCRIDASALLGSYGDGLKVYAQLCEMRRRAEAAVQLGLGRRAYHLALTFAKTLESQGQPLTKQQNVQFKLANMEMDLDAGEAMMEAASNLKGEKRSLRSAELRLFVSNKMEQLFCNLREIAGIESSIEGSACERLIRDFEATRALFEHENALCQAITRQLTAHL